jgi:hypothetical protein
MIFAMPWNPINKRQPDYDFHAEWEALQLLGEAVILFDYDALLNDEEWVNPFRVRAQATTILYRGWMLTEEQYNRFENGLRGVGFTTLQRTDQYVTVHYFPYAYKYSDTLHQYSPNTDIIVGEEFHTQSIAIHLDYKPYIVKDWVKSAKGVENAMHVKKPMDAKAARRTIENMIESRKMYGFNKGIVSKEYIPINEIDGIKQEFRAFILNGQIISIDANNEEGVHFDPIVPNILLRIANELDSTFMTIDFALAGDKKPFILETGAGEVSGLATTANPLAFYKKLLDVLYDNK